MQYRMFCGGDPVAAGIEKPDGAWDLTALITHIAACDACQQFTNGIKASLSPALFEAEEEDSYNGRN